MSSLRALSPLICFEILCAENIIICTLRCGYQCFLGGTPDLQPFNYSSHLKSVSISINSIKAQVGLLYHFHPLNPQRHVHCSCLVNICWKTFIYHISYKYQRTCCKMQRNTYKQVRRNKRVLHLLGALIAHIHIYIYSHFKYLSVA